MAKTAFVRVSMNDPREYVVHLGGDCGALGDGVEVLTMLGEYFGVPLPEPDAALAAERDMWRVRAKLAAEASRELDPALDQARRERDDALAEVVCGERRFVRLYDEMTALHADIAAARDPQAAASDEPLTAEKLDAMAKVQEALAANPDDRGTARIRSKLVLRLIAQARRCVELEAEVNRLGQSNIALGGRAGQAEAERDAAREKAKRVAGVSRELGPALCQARRERDDALAELAAAQEQTRQMKAQREMAVALAKDELADIAAAQSVVDAAVAWRQEYRTEALYHAVNVYLRHLPYDQKPHHAPQNAPESPQAAARDPQAAQEGEAR